MIKLAFRDELNRKFICQSDQPLHHWTQIELVQYIEDCIGVRIIGAVLVEVMDCEEYS